MKNIFNWAINFQKEGVCTIVTKQKLDEGDVLMNEDGSPRHEIVEIVSFKNPAEWGARELDPAMAPVFPTAAGNGGKTPSYAYVDGRDEIPAHKKRDNFFLGVQEHKERAAYVKGNPKSARTHGWWETKCKLGRP